MTISEIISNLYLSNLSAAKTEPLKLYDIDRVVSICQESPVDEISNSIEHHQFPIDDGPHEYRIFENSVDTIRKALDRGDTILVHCRVGMSRSVSAVAATLATDTDRTLTEAFDHIEDQRGLIAPTDDLWASARRYVGDHASKGSLKEHLQMWTYIEVGSEPALEDLRDELISHLPDRFGKEPDLHITLLPAHELPHQQAYEKALQEIEELQKAYADSIGPIAIHEELRFYPRPDNAEDERNDPYVLKLDVDDEQLVELRARTIDIVQKHGGEIIWDVAPLHITLAKAADGSNADVDGLNEDELHTIPEQIINTAINEVSVGDLHVEKL